MTSYTTDGDIAAGDFTGDQTVDGADVDLVCKQLASGEASIFDLTEDGEIALEAIVKGDTVREVLEYVQFDGRDLIHRLQSAVEVVVGPDVEPSALQIVSG